MTMARLAYQPITDRPRLTWPNGAREGRRTAVIGLHTWLLRMPHRVRHLDEGLAHVAQTQGLWATRVGETGAHFRKSGSGEGSV